MRVAGAELPSEFPLNLGKCEVGPGRCPHCLHEQKTQRRGALARTVTLVRRQNQRLTVDVASSEVCACCPQNALA